MRLSWPWRGGGAGRSRRGIIATVLGVVVLGSVCAAAAVTVGAARPPVRAGCVDLPAGRTSSLAITRDGRTRRVRVHVPRRRAARPPLLIALHGAQASGRFMEGYSGLSRLSEREGFVVAYPSAIGPRWAISPAAGEGDVEFVKDLIDELRHRGCASRSQVYAVGVSNGGGMAARLACELSGRLAGVAVVAGGFSTLGPCRPDRPVSVLELHGNVDRVVPYYGKGPTRAGDVQRWLRGWVRRDGCRRSAHVRRTARDVVSYRWTGCEEGSAVAHLKLLGGRHAYPGAKPADPGPPSSVNASVTAWRFLRGRRLAPPG